MTLKKAGAAFSSLILARSSPKGQRVPFQSLVTFHFKLFELLSELYIFVKVGRKHGLARLQNLMSRFLNLWKICLLMMKDGFCFRCYKISRSILFCVCILFVYVYFGRDNSWDLFHTENTIPHKKRFSYYQWTNHYVLCEKWCCLTSLTFVNIRGNKGNRKCNKKSCSARRLMPDAALLQWCC